MSFSVNPATEVKGVPTEKEVYNGTIAPAQVSTVGGAPIPEKPIVYVPIKSSGGTQPLFKFKTIGTSLAGVWGGTHPGRTFGEKTTTIGVVLTEKGKEEFAFSADLFDLADVKEGTRVKITFIKWETTKNGYKMKKFEKVKEQV